MVLVVTLAIAIVAYARWKKASEKTEETLATVAALLGLVLLYVMSRVYNSPFLPGWEGSATFFLFLASALVLGSFWLACVLGISRNQGEPSNAGSLWRMFFCALAGFALVAAFAPASVPESAAGVNSTSVAYAPGTIAVWQGVHTALCGIGLLFLGFGLWRVLHRQLAGSFMAAALLLGICGEIAGRCAFYMSYAKLGM